MTRGVASCVENGVGRRSFGRPGHAACLCAVTHVCHDGQVWTPLRQQTKAGDRVGVLGLGGLGHMALKVIVTVSELNPCHL